MIFHKTTLVSKTCHLRHVYLTSHVFDASGKHIQPKRVSFMPSFHEVSMPNAVTSFNRILYLSGG